MTEKRFIVIDDGLDFMIRDTITDDNLIDADGVADVLNDYEKENEQLKKEIENGIESFKKIQRCHTLTLVEENKQLKQRNDRQAKRLGELYELMAKKDWESLTEIIDDFCSCEEQLQRELGTYCGLE